MGGCLVFGVFTIDMIHGESVWSKCEEQARSMLGIGAESLHSRRIPANSCHKIPLLKIYILCHEGFDTQRSVIKQFQHYNVAINTRSATRRSRQVQIHGSANALNLELLLASFLYISIFFIIVIRVHNPHLNMTLV